MKMRRLAALPAAFLFAATLQAEIDPRTFDRGVKPPEDFYRFVNGAWLQSNQIPPENARWSAFDELNERNWKNVHAICERAAGAGAAASGAARLVGDFYASGMNVDAIDAAGLAPLRAELERIDAVGTPADVMLAIARLRTLGVSAGFGFNGSPDDKNSAVYIAELRQGGLSLPGDGRDADRDYYLNDDQHSTALRAQYVAHVARMFELAGESTGTAQVGAAAVLALETKLATASLSRAQLRNPQESYHKITLAALPGYARDTDWTGFFRAVGAPEFSELNLAHPEFFKAFAAQLQATPVQDWKAYLKWKLLHAAAPYLSAPFEEERFRFYSGVIAGVKEQKPRWRRVAAEIDSSIGDALGQLYVAEFFPPEAKVRVLQLVENVRAAFADRIRAAEWMDAPTKARALEKLGAFGVKMGYPDQWKDYRTLTVDRGAYVLNVLRAKAHEARRTLARIGGAVDRKEWTMTPPTVNARYSSSLNDILFPAGILQPPFFDVKADDAVNYGGIGAVIGHEMSHGFDDRGRQYDAQGNLADWWTPASAENYKLRAAAIVKQFSGYTVLDGLHLKGELTQGENIADLGGLKVAFAALQKALAGKPREKIDDFTPEQRFFLSWARIWRELQREAEQRRRINVDPHSPGRWRVNGPCSNLEEFAAAFAVPEGAPMRRPASERVTIW